MVLGPVQESEASTRVEADEICPSGTDWGGGRRSDLKRGWSLPQQCSEGQLLQTRPRLSGRQLTAAQDRPSSLFSITMRDALLLSAL